MFKFLPSHLFLTQHLKCPTFILEPANNSIHKARVTVLRDEKNKEFCSRCHLSHRAVISTLSSQSETAEDTSHLDTLKVQKKKLYFEVLLSASNCCFGIVLRIVGAVLKSKGVHKNIFSLYEIN